MLLSMLPLILLNLMHLRQRRTEQHVQSCFIELFDVLLRSNTTRTLSTLVVLATLRRDAGTKQNRKELLEGVAGHPTTGSFWPAPNAKAMLSMAASAAW